jgi:hypothetical protein
MKLLTLVGTTHMTFPRRKLIEPCGWPAMSGESPDQLWQLFETVTEAEELHMYADGFNWDTGVEEMPRVIRNLFCDRGTAFLIYCRVATGFMAR